jgi:hypothetical protein
MDAGLYSLSNRFEEGCIRDWLPVCNPPHNRSLSPAVNQKPSISTGY